MIVAALVVIGVNATFGIPFPWNYLAAVLIGFTTGILRGALRRKGGR
jgi:hypothetical protein